MKICLQFALFCTQALLAFSGVLDPLNSSNVNCTSNVTTIRVPFTDLTFDKIDFLNIENVYMTKSLSSLEPISGCVATKRESEQDYYFEIDTSTLDCISTNSDLANLTFTYIIYVKPKIESWMITTTDRKVNFIVSCSFAAVVNFNYITIKPLKGYDSKTAQPISSTFDIDINYYPNGFNQVAASNQLQYNVNTSLPVYIEYKLSESYWSSLILQAKSCWLSPYRDSSLEPKAFIINNWCEVPDMLSPNLNKMVKNSIDKTVQFYFHPFFWGKLQSSTIYVHCDLIICDTVAGETCSKTCNKKRRRAIEDDNSEGDVYSFGPFHVTNEKQLQEDCKVPDNCEHKCVFNDEMKYKCECFEGFTLSSDLKTCIATSREELFFTIIHLELESYFYKIFAICLIIIIFCLSKFVKKT